MSCHVMWHVSYHVMSFHVMSCKRHVLRSVQWLLVEGDRIARMPIHAIPFRFECASEARDPWTRAAFPLARRPDRADGRRRRAGGRAARRGGGRE